MNFAALLDQTRDEAVLQDLSAAESRAFVDLLILAVLADEQITEEELVGLAEQWGQLPFAGDAQLEEVMGDHGYKTREFLEQNMSDDAAIDAFLRERVRPLERLEVRRAALRMVAIVSLADGFDEAEARLCRKLGDALNLSGAVVQEVLDEFAAIQQAVDGS